MAILLVVLFGALMVVYKGWILQILWGWFMVTTFHLPSLSIPQALGLCLISSFISPPYVPEAKTTEERLASFGRMLIGPIVTLVLGWIVRSFMY